MISFFPDLNVWIALSDPAHQYTEEAWNWLRIQPEGTRLLFSRFTQIGFLRLLSNSAVMGPAVLTIREAWQKYDQWLNDPRVEFHPEPHDVEVTFREVALSFGSRYAHKSIGDCYLLAYARSCDATLVTFDKALIDYARKQGCDAVLPG